MCFDIHVKLMIVIINVTVGTIGRSSVIVGRTGRLKQLLLVFFDFGLRSNGQIYDLLVGRTSCMVRRVAVLVSDSVQ
jgi:hypothetical protein